MVNPEEIKAILEIVNISAENLKPLVSPTLQHLHDFGELVRPSLESLVDSSVDLQARAIKRLTGTHGFTTDQAISIVIGMKAGVSKGVASRSSK